MSILSYKKYKVKTKEYRYYRIVGEQGRGGVFESVGPQNIPM